MLYYNDDFLPLIKIWQSKKKKCTKKNKINSDTYKQSLLKSSYNDLIKLKKFNSAKVKRAKTY